MLEIGACHEEKICKVVLRGAGSRCSGFSGISCVFTNDLTPRSRYPKNHKYLSTIIRHDATLGANCTIVCGHEVGHHATIAAGAVVASNVKPHALMTGVPAKQTGWVCECGQVLKEKDGVFACPDCGRGYQVTREDKLVSERNFSGEVKEVNGTGR